MTEPATLSLAACGDILLHGRYHDLARDPGASAVLAPLAAALAGCDLGIANMETVLGTGGTPREDKLCLDGDPSYAAALAGAGLTLMTLANNHCLDFGAQGLAQTRRHLAQAGIADLGAGADLSEASRPLVVERNGLRLGFIAACHASTKPGPAATPESAGLAPFDEPTLLAAIAALRPQVDHVILIPHWGLEYSRFPTPEQVAFAHAAIDAGASAVLGHHSHCIQGIEEYGGGVLAYSLANLTDAAVDWQGPRQHYQCDLKTVDRESILLKLRIDRERVAIQEVLPLWLDDAGRPTLASGERAQKIRQDLEDASARLREGNLQAYWEDTLIDKRVAGPFLHWWHQGSLWDKVRGFRPGQLVTLYLLAHTYLRVKLSRSESKWMLFNPRNDGKPMPYVAPREDDL